MERLLYKSIIEKIKVNPDLQKINRIGMCRMWVKVAMERIKTMSDELSIEAREVDLEPHLQHTFLRITHGEDRPFLIDGIGSAKHPPYFGYEDEAPPHLQNSRSDIINVYCIDNRHK